MNPGSFHFLTQDRMGWKRWTRKRRLKFRKRYLRQHGRRFGWFVSEFKYCHNPTIASNMILFVRSNGVDPELYLLSK